MSMEHTNPFGHSFDQLATFESRDGLRTPVRLLEAQYNRARACWNACEGIPTYQLFGESDAPNNLGEMIDALRADKAELLAGLQYLLGPKDDENIGWRRHTGHATLMTCEFCGKHHEDTTLIEHMSDCPVTVTRALIAKHKEASHG